MIPEISERLNKMNWRRDLAMRGHERNGMSPELSEALRNEIRTALEAGGGAFDVNVARRVYDLAMAARDMCVVATDSVKEAIEQIKDTNGPMETLDGPGTPESAVQASESFGARLFREIMAIVPTLARPREGDDPKALVHALAEARSRGMHDVAEELEVKLFGRALSGPRPIAMIAVDAGRYEHGFADGKAGAPPSDFESPNYEHGYIEGTTARFLEGDAVKECTCQAFDNDRDGMHHDQACPRFERIALDEKEIARLHPDTRERYAQNAASILASLNGAAEVTP